MRRIPRGRGYIGMGEMLEGMVWFLGWRDGGDDGEGGGGGGRIRRGLGWRRGDISRKFRRRP